MKFVTSLALALPLSLFPAAPPAAAEGPTLDLSAGIHVIHAEIAYTNAVRMQGLMFREHLGPNQGMLFVFPELGEQCMWMKNTLIPLSVAFIDAKGAIINVEDMAPQTLDSHCAKAPARYALEMELGWVKKHGAANGSR